ncbi:MAG: alpha/beta hydrolase [Anaerolineales bacterium]
MKSHPTIHPELQGPAKFAPKLNYNKFVVWLLNKLMRLAPSPKAPDDLQIENIFITGPDGNQVRVRVYKPKSANEALPALLWIHGGGYLIGNPEQDENTCIQYVRELKISVFSVEYRLALQKSFPAGLEDCYATLQWIATHAIEFGIDKERIAIGGASAGGGLAAALAQLAHDRQEVQPIFQLLVYPMLDDRTALRTDLYDINIAWNQPSNRFGWSAYLGKECGSEDVPNYSVPARRENLAGLARAWVGVGDLDLFYTEDLLYAQRLNEAGADCEVVVVPGAFHGFDAFTSQASVVQEFRKSQIAALRKAFTR